MRAVKTIQKYQCDFCKKRSVRHIIELHEKRCFRNPNRYCDYCDNTGKVTEDFDIYHSREVDCPYCRQFDAQKLKEIQERENKDLLK